MPFDGRIPQQLLPAVTAHLINGRQRIAVGWCQNRLTVSKWSLRRGRQDHYCMLGAINGDGLTEAALYIAQAIDEIGCLPRNHDCVPNYDLALFKVMAFNDFPGRTQAGCVAIYDRAIELSLEAEQ